MNNYILFILVTIIFHIPLSAMEETKNLTKSIISEENVYGNTPLHREAYLGNCENIEKLIHGGQDVHSINKWGKKPWWYAAEQGHFLAFRMLYPRVSKRLIGYKKDLEDRAHQGVNDYIYAMPRTEIDFIKKMNQSFYKKLDMNKIEKKLDIEHKFYEENLILLCAKKINQFLDEKVLIIDELAVPKEVLSHIVVMRKTAYGNTLLHEAAFLGKCDEIKRLLDLGVDRIAQNKWGRTPAWYAAEQGHFEAFKCLYEKDDMRIVDCIEHDAVNYLIAIPGEEVLQYIVENNILKDLKLLDLYFVVQGGHPEILGHLLEKFKELIEKGCIDTKAFLFPLVFNGTIDHLKLLYEADKECIELEKNYPLYKLYKCSPYYYAACYGKNDMLEFFKQKDKKFVFSDNESCWDSPLYSAVMHHQNETVEYLICDLKFNVNDALDYAISQNDPKIVALLLSYGALVDEGMMEDVIEDEFGDEIKRLLLEAQRSQSKKNYSNRFD